MNNPFYITYLTEGHQLFQVQKEQVPGITAEPVEIQFSYLDYLPFHTDIYYKLNYQEWEKVPNGSRSIRFDKLAYGDYTIRFKVNNKEGEQISFSVLRPWYMRIPALLLFFLFITSLLFFLYKRRIHQQQKETTLLLEKNRLEEDLRHSMLTSIKSQMNPHFLFNALNTIQSYIITEDKDHAASYLSKFSRLTRSILEMSEKKTVLLKEEIDALLLYIELEKMRFPDLTFHFQVDTSLNTQNVIIPSMIIQPYIENAIKHGLLHKVGMKELRLHFFQKDNLLCIDIKDNGIGRTKSEHINRQRKNHHQSFASEANRKRVELLQAEDTRIQIFYEDLYDSNDESSGTIVHIQLPLKFQHD